MKPIIPLIIAAFIPGAVFAATVSGPDGRLAVTVDTLAGGVPSYAVAYDGITVIQPSPLGFRMADGKDYSRAMAMTSAKADTVSRSFVQDRIKHGRVDWRANTLSTTFRGPEGQEMTVEWEVADNDIAFRYQIPSHKGTARRRDSLRGHGLPLPCRLDHHLRHPAERRHGGMETHQAKL